MPVRPHDLLQCGQLFLWQPLKPFLPCPDVHVCKDRRVVEEGGNDGGSGDREIWNAKEFAHNERSRPHDRRHQLSARRGAGLYRPRVIGLITDALHQRNGKGSSGRDICHGRAAYRP